MEANNLVGLDVTLTLQPTWPQGQRAIAIDPFDVPEPSFDLFFDDKESSLSTCKHLCKNKDSCKHDCCKTGKRRGLYIIKFS
jgi:hypothetical protein